MARYLHLLSLLIVFSWGSSWAQNCSPVDLRNTPGGRALGPVQNQGDAPWCVPVVISDLVTFRTRQRYSAAAIGINFNYNIESAFTKWLQNAWNGRSPVVEHHSSTFGNVFSMNRTGLQCLERDLPMNSPASHIISDLRRLSEIKKAYDQTGECSMENLNMVHRMFPGASASDLFKVLETSYKADLHFALLTAACAKRNLRMPPASIVTSNNWNDLDEQLGHGNIVGLNYSSNILYNHTLTKSRGGHASTIIGRRMRGNKCEYLLRNSWGRSCGGYDKSYPCEEGNLWIPGEILKEVKSEVAYLR